MMKYWYLKRKSIRFSITFFPFSNFFFYKTSFLKRIASRIFCNKRNEWVVWPSSCIDVPITKNFYWETFWYAIHFLFLLLPIKKLLLCLCSFNRWMIPHLFCLWSAFATYWHLIFSLFCLPCQLYKVPSISFLWGWFW